MSKVVTVVPVKDKFLPGEPAVEKDVSPEEAGRLVASGAFTVKPAVQGPLSKPLSKDR